MVSFFHDMLVMWVLKTEDHLFNKSLAVGLKKRNVMNI